MTASNGERSRLRNGDLLALATIGIRSRPLRALLSALGVAIGIGAVVAVLGVTRSSQADLLARLDRLGTNLLTVVSGQTVGGDEVPLPTTASLSVARTEWVSTATGTAELPSLHVFRTDQVPQYRTGGIDVRASGTNLLDTLNVGMTAGVFLSDATSHYPVVVLGHDAAGTLGIDRVDPQVRIWLGGQWFVVAGILQPVELAPEIDRSALIGMPVAVASFGYDGHPTRLYVKAQTEHTVEVAGLLGRAVNPEQPNAVAVSRPSDLLESRLLLANSATRLLVGLGAIALLVGAVGIANTMVISVLERRTEIGLRRALGATRRHIAAQFVAESLLLAVLGGVAGVVLGALTTLVTALARGWQPLVPPEAVWAGLAVAALVGGLAGLYPAARAASLTPTDALRTS
jgi:putative ABC transport system permease protein